MPHSSPARPSAARHRLARRAALALTLPLALAACGGAGDTAAPSTEQSVRASAEPAATPSAGSAASAAPEEPTGSPAGTSPGVSTAVSEIAVGDCFADVAGGLNDVASLPVVPCDEPHTNEVFALLELPDGDFPGGEEVQGLATEGCFAEFPAYVGAEVGVEGLDAFPVTPTAESWESGDRQVVCVVTSTSPRTGSAQGAGA